MRLSRINTKFPTGGAQAITMQAEDLDSDEGPNGIQEGHPEDARQEQDESPQEPPPIDAPPIHRGKSLRI